jgi:CheY-like chemotaxis protein
MVHANGDAALDMVTAAFTQTAKLPAWDAGKRHRIEHCSLLHDEQIVRSVIVRLLAGLGYAAEAVAGGDAALALLRDPAKDVALVITDLHMPGMDGLQLTREIRRLRPDVPVVLASGFSDKVDPAQIGELGFAAQLDKPFGLDALTQTLANALA